MKYLILFFLLCAACDPQSSGAPAVVPPVSPVNPGQPVDPNQPGPTPTPVPVPNPQFSLSYKKATKTFAPINGWSTKTVTVTGYCVVYTSQTFCWDDGIKTLFIPGISQGFTYTYWGIGTQGSSWTPCYGGCQGDMMSSPRFISPSLLSSLTSQRIYEVATQGQPVTVNCAINNNVLNCGDFVVDLNQPIL